MRVALYARVSTESQQARGTIGSQLAVLRERVGLEGDEPVAEFCDDGHSGARLDRPGLDALRDAAEAGLIERVWCLSPDRLARVYAYQVIVLDELARHGVSVRFTDAPPIDDDPQAKLLTQVQGVIAEYERAKIAERYRRGKLFRSRNGEVLAWRTPYGYRRHPRDAHGPARLVVFEPEAAIVRRIFDDSAHGGHSLREIIRRLAADGVPSPTGSRGIWGTSTLSKLLRNEAYIGRVYFNRTEAVPDPRPGRRSRQVPRPREDWITIAVPAIVDDQTFEAAGRVSRDNTQWSQVPGLPEAGLSPAGGLPDGLGEGMVVLVLHRRDEPELAVQPAVVVPVDVLGHGDLQVIDPVPRAFVADEFGLVQRVERLGHRVIVGIPDRPDRSHDAGLGEPLGVADRPVLDSPVRMVDQVGQVGADVLSAPDPHLQRIQRQIGVESRGQLPADDPAGEHVEHERRVHPPAMGRHIGQVGHPQLVRCRRGEVAVHQVWAGVGGGRPDRGARDLDPRAAHAGQQLS